jgi:hypothetical protein
VLSTTETQANNYKEIPFEKLILIPKATHLILRPKQTAQPLPHQERFFLFRQAQQDKIFN